MFNFLCVLLGQVMNKTVIFKIRGSSGSRGGEGCELRHLPSRVLIEGHKIYKLLIVHNLNY